MKKTLRRKNWIGAAINAATSIAGSLIGGIQQKKAQEQQAAEMRRQQNRSDAYQSAANLTAAADNGDVEEDMQNRIAFRKGGKTHDRMCVARKCAGGRKKKAFGYSSTSLNKTRSNENLYNSDGDIVGVNKNRLPNNDQYVSLFKGGGKKCYRKRALIGKGMPHEDILGEDTSADQAEYNVGSNLTNNNNNNKNNNTQSKEAINAGISAIGNIASNLFSKPTVQTSVASDVVGANQKVGLEKPTYSNVINPFKTARGGKKASSIATKNGRPDVVRGGSAIPMGNGFYYMDGRKHERGGIDVGKNAKTGLEVEGGEVMHMGKKGAEVFSAMPILNGKSPAQRVLNGEDPNEVFARQENWKKVNKINDDGTKKACFGSRRTNIRRAGGLSRSNDYKSSSKPYPSVKSKDFAGKDRSYPIPTKADAVDALRLAGLHGRTDVRKKVYSKYPELKNNKNNK